MSAAGLRIGVYFFYSSSGLVLGMHYHSRCSSRSGKQLQGTAHQHLGNMNFLSFSLSGGWFAKKVCILLFELKNEILCIPSGLTSFYRFSSPQKIWLLLQRMQDQVRQPVCAGVFSSKLQGLCSQHQSSGDARGMSWERFSGPGLQCSCENQG